MDTVKIAIPLAEGKLTAHFGHCRSFAFCVADPKNGAVQSKEEVVPPPHEPGVLPRWLHEQGITHIIAGGMGGRAQSLFVENGIQVIVGAPCESPEVLIEAWAQGTLVTGENACSH